MKKIITILFALLIVNTSIIFAQELPKDGAVISMEGNQIQLVAGEKLVTDLTLIKSKRYKRVAFGGLTTKAPEGITVTFEQDSNEKNLFHMTLLANDVFTTDTFTLIIKGEGKNAHKVRGLAISVKITNNQIVTSN